MKFEIKHKITGNVLFSLECDSFKLCVEAANLSGVDLDGADFSGADLRGINLDEAILDGVNFRSADLDGADFSGAELSEADFRGANLDDVDFSGAELRGVNFRSADLDGADFSGADFRGANFRGANFRGANLDGSAWPLHCGSFHAHADDRLVAQLLHHVIKLNTDNCSGGVQESIEHIRQMAISDLFCEYRDDIKPIINNKEIE